MVEVLAANAYSLRLDPKQREKMRPYPPLSTLVAASLLRRDGYSVALHDSMFEPDLASFATALGTHRPAFVLLWEDSFNFLVKMCLSRVREAAICMATMAREAGATVIVAGPDATDNPELYIRNGADFALLGEAENTAIELLGALSGRTSVRVSEIPGICAAPRWTGLIEPLRTGRRAPERQLNRFPLPAWDLIDADAYRRAWLGAHGKFSLNMASTRGCPYHCNWCAKPIWGQHYAIRSSASVAEELAQLKALHRPDHIWFADDIFGLNTFWLQEFAEEIHRRDALVPFTIQSRVDRMSPESVDALRRAGCAEVWLGAESGSQRVLDSMDKGIAVADIKPATERLKRAGIEVGLFLQIGYPGETWDDILATVRMVRDCVPDHIGVSVSYPLPGTKFHAKVSSGIGHKDRWAHSGDLAMMFRGTYSSDFYRKVHRLLHLELDARKELQAGANGRISIQAKLDSLAANWFELGQTESSERCSEGSQPALAYKRRVGRNHDVPVEAR